MAEALTEHGPDARDDEGKTPLHSAAYSMLANACRSLIAAGADVDAIDAGGNTALHYACWQALNDGDEVIAQVLLDAGADATVRNHEGDTAFDLAASFASEALRTVVHVCRQRCLVGEQVYTGHRSEPSSGSVL